jgi:predicted amidohydrolase
VISGRGSEGQVRVSLVQLDCAWLDRERNAERMAAFVEQEASQHGADLVVFPELASTGYLSANPDRDFIAQLLEQSEPIPGPTTERLGKVAADHGVHVVAGISQKHSAIPHCLYNSAAFIGPDGALIGVYQKAHAALQEKHVFAGGSTAAVFPSALGSVAINICYDVRFPELARTQALRGAEILVTIWAASEQPGDVPSDSVIVRCRSRAMENLFYVLGCNRSGCDGGQVFFGRSVIVAPNGETLASSDNAEDEVLRATLTDEDLRERRIELPIFRDRRPDLYGPVSEPV